ncbi:hypothetical protein [Microbacterium suwonense]|uniref:FHA domain-containing protein n=1 Tax=Microbacterium suwonense TaxID=683047 RepID=A0ABM8FY00_9MICO|nr:hypothetical protein [Microbacterium suwonense]BDZ40521.1 hypothetical protein GCM10025863_31350 [Microbacterium suwonense]
MNENRSGVGGDREAMAEDLRRRPADAGTTHSEWGSGDPHLLVTREGERSTFGIAQELIRIGSATDAELVLDGADPLHATITHDDRDEYVLTMHGEGQMNAWSEDDSRTEVLRTGARFTIADWTLVFMRAEYADHGRPFGGREGGELSDQPPQPQRPDYARQQASGSDQQHAAGSGEDGEEGGWEVRNG